MGELAAPFVDPSTWRGAASDDGDVARLVHAHLQALERQAVAQEALRSASRLLVLAPAGGAEAALGSIETEARAEQHVVVVTASARDARACEAIDGVRRVCHGRLHAQAWLATLAELDDELAFDAALLLCPLPRENEPLHDLVRLLTLFVRRGGYIAHLERAGDCRLAGFET